jgi:hypothetical protein
MCFFFLGHHGNRVVYFLLVLVLNKGRLSVPVSLFEIPCVTMKDRVSTDCENVLFLCMSISLFTPLIKIRFVPFNNSWFSFVLVICQDAMQ